jgi:ABC-type multidrug transport system fused ATPase/permease subunit
LASKFATDCFAFQGSLGEKNSTIIMTFGMFIAGFAIAFNYGWLMTLVLLVSIPAIGISGYVFMLSIQRKDQNSAKDYA